MPSASKLHFEQRNSTNSHVCESSFDFLDMKFSSIELADPNEYFFVSDNTEYVVTRLENSWLLHNVIDDDLLMFGLSGNRLIKLLLTRIFQKSIRFHITYGPFRMVYKKPF